MSANTFAPNPAVSTKLPALPAFSPPATVCIAGAGVFGIWSALALQKLGFSVTIIDPYGPGNSRSSSGDETRVVRSTYGNNELYFALNVRSIELWKEYQALFPYPVFFNTGVLWLCYEKSTPIVDDSVPFSEKYNSPYQFLTQRELSDRYPLLQTSDINHAVFDPHGGYVMARESCQYALSLFISKGGTFIRGKAAPDQWNGGNVSFVTLDSGERIKADLFLFACGAWLPSIFPAVLGKTINCTRQEVYYFGAPAAYENLPCWIDVDGQNFYYGIASNSFRGFKVGVDVRGPAFDPETGNRSSDPGVYNAAQNFLAHRFPGLKNSPLLESRVCPYENSPDGNFIFDVCPGTGNVFLLGGGSGHGFKHGPALGELVGDVISGKKSAPDLFRLKIS